MSELGAKLNVDASTIDSSVSMARYGIDSLSAVELTHTIETNLGFPLRLNDLLHNYSLDQLSEWIEAQRLHDRIGRFTTIAPVSRASSLPASFDQEQLWILQQLDPESPCFNIAVAFRLAGELDIEALEDSFRDIVLRHESLRTTFQFAGDGLRQIIHPAEAFVPHLKETAVFLKERAEQDALTQMIAEVARPFDLTKGPLLRASLYNFGPNEHGLFIVLHHIISDGWSVGIVLDELARLYTSHVTREVPALAELPIQFADFAHCQRLESEDSSKWLPFWSERLRGHKFSLSLPLDFARPKSSSRRGARRSMTLEQPVYQAVKEVSQQRGVTVFITFLAAFKALLYYYCNQDDIAIITPIANRELTETAGIVGCLRSFLVIRTSLQGKRPFGELVRSVESSWLEAYAHRQAPLGKLIENLQIKRPRNNAPLFPVMFAFQSFPAEAPKLKGLRSSVVDIPLQVSSRDLSFYVDAYDQGMVCAVEYDTELFKGETISDMFETFNGILRRATDNWDLPLSEILNG
jgi:acyl carrier protein